MGAVSRSHKMNKLSARVASHGIMPAPAMRALFKSSERGSSIVESALVLPLLLLILTGILAFGVALNNYLVLTNAVNVGTQQLSISRGISTDPCKTAATAITGSAFYLVATNITLTFTIGAGTPYTNNASLATCPGLAASMVQGASATIKGTYPCTLTLAGMSTLGGATCLQAQTAEVIQ
jgi:Flp pilus assembly protein TadG